MSLTPKRDWSWYYTKVYTAASLHFGYSVYRTSFDSNPRCTLSRLKIFFLRQIDLSEKY